MQLNPYLYFDGQCEAAFKLYEQSLGGKINAMITYGGTPAAGHAPADWGGKILHATITVGDKLLMGSDVPPGDYQKPAGFSVSLSITDPAEAERVFNALAEGGNVKMPLQKTFWAERFGMLTDRFGVPWLVNCEQKRD